MDGLERFLVEKIFIRGDINGHRGKYNVGFEMMHEGYVFEDKNEGDAILEFVIAYDLVPVNALRFSNDNI